MNRLTKSLVVTSALLAAAAELYLVSDGISDVGIAALALVAVVVAAQAWRPGLPLAPLLAVAYVAPAAWLLWLGQEAYSFEIAWVAPLAVLACMGRDAWRWSLPAPWRLPLVFWALVVSVSWPIVALRELNFDVGMLWVRGAATTSVGVSPGESALWSIHVALGHMVGLLWIDALWRWFGRDSTPTFPRRVLWPLGAAACLAFFVGGYQGFVRIDVLNGHVWPSMNRAAGTFMDANTFGMVAALWGPALIAAALSLGGSRALLLSALAFAASFAGVWTSGSRTALAVFVLSALAAVPLIWSAITSGVTPRRRPLAAAGSAAALVALALIAVIIARGASTTTVFDRIPSLVPGMEEGASVRNTLTQLWERFGYGTAAVRMIAAHPLQGVGVGSFNTLVRDYGDPIRGRALAPDNAQNWYRHIIAEFGALGSLGAIWWSALFALRLFSTSTLFSRDSIRRLVGALLATFGLISLVGMPGQATPVIITFWTFVFWFARHDSTARPGVPAPDAPWPSTQWAVVLLLVTAHAGLTMAAARGDLLPPHRAERFGWPYNFGISALEQTPDGLGRRWTTERSLSTIPVQGRVLKLVAWVEHPDADQHPVHLRIVADGRQVFEGDLKRASAIYLDIPATPGRSTLVLETFIDRTFRPSNYGSRDRRDLGLAIQDWRWE